MKTLFTAILSIVMIAGFSQTPERKISSQVKEVTVFLQGAQVTRTATVDLKPGASTLILHGTSPHIQENSIQAEVNMGVKIIGASFRVNYLKDLKQSETSVELSNERDRLSELINNEKISLTIFSEEELMLKSNKVIGGQQTGVNVKDLKIAVDYYRQRLMDIQEHKQQISARMDEYQKRARKIDEQLEEMKATKPMPEGEIIVKVEGISDVRIQLKVSYLVTQATWFPTYDIRAENIQSPIAITYKANISQQSGEDWESIKLTVSSANPSSSGAKPSLNPWILGFNNGTRTNRIAINNNMVHGRILDSDGTPIPGVNIVIKGTSNGTVSDANGQYSMALSNASKLEILVFSFIGYQSQEAYIDNREVLDVTLNADVTQLAEVVVTGYGVQGDEDSSGRLYGLTKSSSREPKIKQTIAATPIIRTTNLEFTLDNPYTITSGGQNQAVDMIEYEIPADYEYYSAPKLETDAFLTARMTDWDNYNFLEGQASIFFEGKYIGKTILDTRSTSDTLTLSLGRDKNVIITREKVQEHSSNQFVGSNRKSMFAYEISVRNKKAYPINIRIEDQLPVPNTKEISVDNIEDSHALKGENDGLLTWNLKIQPGKTEKIDLRYEIKYPKYHNIILE